MKQFAFRFYFQWSVGFLWGAGLMSADSFGKLLLIGGALAGIALFWK